MSALNQQSTRFARDSLLNGCHPEPSRVEARISAGAFSFQRYCSHTATTMSRRNQQYSTSFKETPRRGLSFFQHTDCFAACGTLVPRVLGAGSQTALCPPGVFEPVEFDVSPGRLQETQVVNACRSLPKIARQSAARPLCCVAGHTHLCHPHACRSLLRIARQSPARPLRYAAGRTHPCHRRSSPAVGRPSTRRRRTIQRASDFAAVSTSILEACTSCRRRLQTRSSHESILPKWWGMKCVHPKDPVTIQSLSTSQDRLPCEYAANDDGSARAL